MFKCIRSLVFFVAIITVAAAYAFTGAADDRAQIANSARGILSRRCFSCHGANGIAKKNIFVLDRERLIANRIVVPGDQGSTLLKAVESGAMPFGGPELSSEEKSLLRAWIVGGAQTWSDPDSSSSRKFVTESAATALIRNDLLQARERTRPFLRYFSLVHLYNAGVNDNELEVYRSALSKLTNSLSWHRDISPLAAIDPARTIFRLDLRDYNWTTSTWDILLSNYPYGVRSSASIPTEQLSGSRVPYIRADWFVANASVPPLYHEILRLPKTAVELELQLGIDVQRDFQEEKNMARAGLRSSGVSANNRVLERHVSPNGAYWKSFDFRNNLDDQNIFKNPLQLTPAGGEIIFNLPNGLQGYLLIDAFGRRIDAAPIAIVADRNNPDDPVIHNGRSCMSCHYAGVQPFKDDVRPVVQESAFASFDKEKALAIYLTQSSLDRLAEKDQQRFAQAVEQLGATAKIAQDEPINALSRRFNAEIGLRQAAAEAGLDTAEFQNLLAGRPRLLGLGYGQLLVPNGGIKRDAWDRNFGDLVRELQLGEYEANPAFLQRRNREGLNNAVDLAISRSRSPVRAAAIGADPTSVLRSARTIAVRSMTIYLEAEQFEGELRKLPEFKALDLAIVKDDQLADIKIEINRSAFSFNYSYSATNPLTSLVVASGKVTAWNGDVAAPRIAKELLKSISDARENASQK